MFTRASLLLFASLCLPLAAAQPWVGAAYDLDSGELLYLEVHRTPSHLGGDELAIDYLNPDGSALGSKRVRFEDEGFVPEFLTSIPAVGFEESVVFEDEGIRVEYRPPGGDRDVATISPDSDGPVVVADAGFDRFIRDRWDSLTAGERERLRFLVPSMGRFLAFRVRHLGTDEIDGVDAERFVMEPANWFLRMIVDPIEVAYTSEERALLRYTGISNLPGEGGRNLEVDIRFAAGAPSSDDARVASLDDAEQGGVR